MSDTVSTRKRICTFRHDWKDQHGYGIEIIDKKQISDITVTVFDRIYFSARAQRRIGERAHTVVCAFSPSGQKHLFCGCYYCELENKPHERISELLEVEIKNNVLIVVAKTAEEEGGVKLFTEEIGKR